MGVQPQQSAGTVQPAPTKEIPQIVQLDEQAILTSRNKAVERILRQEMNAKQAGKDSLRRQLICRFVCFQKDLQHPLVQSVVKFLMDLFPSRIDLAIQWLYQEYYQCLLEGLSTTDRQSNEWEKSREQVIKEDSRYNQLLQMILERLCIALQPSKESDPLFRSFILRVPDLSSHTIQTLQQFCASEEVDRVSLGLTSLREIILRRPAARDSTLEIFLKYTVFSPNDSTRNLAITITMESFYPIRVLSEQILKFATEILSSLSEVEEVEKRESLLPEEIVPLTVSIGEEVKATTAELELPIQKLSPKHVEQKTKLFIQLCNQDHSLIKQFAEIYVKCIRDVQRILERESKELFQSIHQVNEAPLIFEILENHPVGSESLLLHMLRNIIIDTVIDQKLAAKLQSLFEEGKLDARFLIHTLRVSDKNTVLSYLPALVSITSHKLVASAMYSILSTPESENSISPTELLVQLHNLDKNKQGIEVKRKQQSEAIQICLKAPVFSKASESLAVVLQQVSEISPIPIMFLRTMIDSYKMHPKLEAFILELLSKLITKQVWQQSDAWKGFIKCCELAKIKAFPIFFQLPPAAFSEALKMCNEQFRNEFLKYCKQVDNIPQQLAPVLQTYNE